MASAAAIVLGSALGGAARYWVSGVVGRRVGETFPWGTMAVNISGAFAIGLLAAVAAGQGWAPAGAAWHLGAIGFLGSYTTVSSFSLQTLALARDGQMARAMGNVAASLGLCLAAAALGLAAGAALVGAIPVGAVLGAALPGGAALGGGAALPGGAARPGGAALGGGG